MPILPPPARRLLLISPLLLAIVAGCSTRRTGQTADAAPHAPPALAETAGRAAPVQDAPAEPPPRLVVIDGKFAPAPDVAMGDPETIARILDEGMNRNQVMDHLSHLCEQIGPRLTGSTKLETANRWARDRFESWGLDNAHLWQWGEIPVRFDRGPSTGAVLLRVERDPPRSASGETPAEPVISYETVREMEFTTQAWMAGTDGPVRAPVIRMPESEEEYEAVADQIPGSWILIRRPPEGSRQGVGGRGGLLGARYRQRIDVRTKHAEGADPATLAVEERVILANPAGFVSPSRDERVWTGAVPGWRELGGASIPPDVEIVVRLSDYDFINSRLADGESVELEFDLQHAFTTGPIPVYNTIAEIRGTDLPDELVIISAHLDSWNGPGSQGTTDNGTGSAVTLETARLLMAAGAQPRRTIRFVLWSGEEQGLLGSRAYVQHLRETGELDRISAVFVDDGGTNYQGGLECIESMVPMLAAATAPVTQAFPEMPVNIRPRPRMPRGGGSDHASFNAAGIPGFFWDEVGRAVYGYGWHTQNDRLDLAIPEYLVQSSTCSAITAYNLACAQTLLPRQQSEEPAPEEGPQRPRRQGRPQAEPSGAN